MGIKRIIGIDFGTSTSVVRIKRYKENNTPVEDKLSTKSLTFNNGSTMVPTLIRKVGEDSYYGYEAEVNKRNSILHQNFKMQLESDDPSQKKDAKALTAEFLKYLAKVYKEQSEGGYLGEFSDEEKTIISYPVKWSDDIKEFMISSAKDAGFPNVTGMNEAEAAIHAVALQNDDLLKSKGYFEAEKAVNILLLDMGAGTTDLVLCRHIPGANSKTEILCTYPKDGNILLGGREVDELLKKYIVEQVPEENRETVEKRIGFEKYKAWKEHIVSPELKNNHIIFEFSELETIMDYCDFDVSFSIDRKVFEEFSKEYISKIPTLVNGCLSEANMTGDDVDLVILTGGHSKWYFTNEILSGELSGFGDCGLSKIKADKNRIVSIALPQETVALGLVYSNTTEELPVLTKKEQVFETKKQITIEDDCEPSYIICQHCNTKCEPDSKFCENCGGELDGITEKSNKLVETRPNQIYDLIQNTVTSNQFVQGISGIFGFPYTVFADAGVVIAHYIPMFNNIRKIYGRSSASTEAVKPILDGCKREILADIVFDQVIGQIPILGALFSVICAKTMTWRFGLLFAVLAAMGEEITNDNVSIIANTIRLLFPQGSLSVLNNVRSSSAERLNIRTIIRSIQFSTPNRAVVEELLSSVEKCDSKDISVVLKNLVSKYGNN